MKDLVTIHPGKGKLVQGVTSSPVAWSAAVFLALSISISGCAHVKSGADDKSIDGDSARTLTDVLNRDPKSLPDGPVPKGTVSRNNQGELMIRGVKLQHTDFDYPVTINSKVEQWVDYFLGRGRPHFTRYLERSEFFIPYITPVLRQNKMPEDLVYLAMIESGFNNHAASRAKAVGPWQFISATGKRYGLMVNWWVDERRDTRKSTLAAVDYLRDLYQMFNSWELAAAAYNAGETKIARAIQRFGTKDFWVLTKQRYLRPETRDYVPKIIAAALIAKNRTQFGFPASTIKPGKDEAISGDGEVVKVEKAGDVPAPTRGDTLASLLKEDDAIASSEATTEGSISAIDDEEDEVDTASLISPAALNATAQNLNANGEPIPLAKPISIPQVSKKGEMSGEELVEMEVQSPADLLKIATAAGLSYQTVKSLNPDVLRWCTPPNVSTYRIKLPMSAKDKFLTAYNHSAYPRKVDFLSYKVRRGDNLARIASHFGIRVDPMSDLNGISPRMPLRSGTRVILPIPNDRSRTLASLEVRDAPESRRRHRHPRHMRSSHVYKVSYKRRAQARAGHMTDNDG